MRVDQARKNGTIAEIEIGLACAVRFDGDDALADNGEDAAGQGGAGDGEEPVGGEGPGQYHNSGTTG